MIFGGGFLVRWIVWLRWIYRQHHPRRALSVILTLCTLNNTDKRCRWKCVESFSRRCLSWSAFDRVALAESIELNSTLAALPPEAAENSNLISGDYIQRLIIYFTLIIVAFVSSGHAYSIKYTTNVAFPWKNPKFSGGGCMYPFFTALGVLVTFLEMQSCLRPLEQCIYHVYLSFYWYIMAARNWISKHTIKNKHTRKVWTPKCEDKMLKC